MFSHINTQQIFCGHYWDDLACVGAFKQKNILMLGLGRGAAIRPILGINPKANITVLEISEALIIETKDFYREHFPDLSFNILKGDAFTDSWGERVYDTIFIDLYDLQGYLQNLICDSFVAKVKKHLSMGGQVLINSFGVPMQFHPFNLNTFQNQLSQKFRKAFAHHCYLPFRRNATAIFSEFPISLVHVHPRNLSLSAIDSAYLDLLKIRLHNLPNLPFYQTEGEPSPLYKDHDLKMMTGWTDLIEHLKNNYGVNNLDKPRDLLDLISNQERCLDLLGKMIQKNDLQLIFIPILIAGQSNFESLQVEWFIQTILDDTLNILSFNQSIYIQYFLTQVGSMIINPKFKFRRFFFKFASKCNALKEAL